jgi:hypothetical protein
MATRGVPKHIRSDNGPEMTANEWLAKIGVTTLYIEPGSPWENGYVESFNGKLRDELLNGEVFHTVHEAKVLIEQWRQHCNTVRPHSSLGYRPPALEAIGILPRGAAARAPTPGSGGRSTELSDTMRSVQRGKVRPDRASPHEPRTGEQDPRRATPASVPPARDGRTHDRAASELPPVVHPLGEVGRAPPRLPPPQLLDHPAQATILKGSILAHQTRCWIPHGSAQ